MLRSRILAPLLWTAIIALTFWVYIGTLENGFVWDTLYYLRYAHLWDSGLGLDEISWMLASTEVANWHPLTWLSWAIDYQIYGGLNPAGYHFSNVLIHALNSVLVGWLALRLFKMAERNPESKDPERLKLTLAAAFCGVLFAVHPQHVQSVAWVAQRKDLLCQLFVLSAMLSYLRTYGSRPVTGRPGNYWTLLFYALAVMSKPMAVSLPLILLILDFYPLRRLDTSAGPWSRALLVSLIRRSYEKLSFFALAVILIIVTLFAQSSGGAMSEVPLQLRLLNAFNSIGLYLHKFLWPADFSPFYPYFVNAIGDIGWPQWLPVLEFLFISSVAWIAWRKGRPEWLAAWIFYLITLIPVLGIVQVGVQGAADRYAYLPTLPFFILLGGSLLSISNRLGKNGKWLLPLTMILAIMALVPLTKQQVRTWNNSLSLWAHAARHYPDDPHINVQLGITLLNAGQNAAATSHFEQAARIQTEPSENLAWLGLAYMRMNRYSEAVDVFIRLGLNAEDIPGLVLDEECVQYNIGWNFAHMGMPDESIDLFSRVKENPVLRQKAESWMNWLGRHGPGGIQNDRLREAGLPDQCEHPLPLYMPVER